MTTNFTYSHLSAFFRAGAFFALLLTSCQPKTETAPLPGETPAPSASTPSPSPAAEFERTSVPTQPPPALNRSLTLDPALTTDPDSILVSGYLYEGLVRLDANGSPQPALADSWEISDDQLDYIFQLRGGAAFSDGSPLTTDIIVENFNRWFDPSHPLHGNGNYAAWQKAFLGFLGQKGADKRPVSTVDGIQKVDFNTVLIHLNRPEPNLLIYLADPAFSILKTDALAADSAYGGRSSAIVASGPYALSSWTDDGLTLSPNPYYWGEKPQDDLSFVWK
jgi:peptide/nickel transport system substrate-binding protein